MLPAGAGDARLLLTLTICCFEQTNSRTGCGLCGVAMCVPPAPPRSPCPQRPSTPRRQWQSSLLVMAAWDSTLWRDPLVYPPTRGWPLASATFWPVGVQLILKGRQLPGPVVPVTRPTVLGPQQGFLLQN